MRTDNPVIKLSGVSMRYDDRLALKDVDFTVNSGDFFAITGPNGGGKTTLLRIILKLLKPTSGRVEYFDNGVAVDRLSIGYLPQKNMIDSHFPIDVRQVIESGLMAKKDIDRAERADLVDRMIELVGLGQHSRSSIGQLSGGQLQRALLGRALISSPEVIVLDEPLSYVDKRFEHHIYDIMRELAPSTTILLVSHEISTIAAMANRHLIVDCGIHECHAATHYAPPTHCDE